MGNYNPPTSRAPDSSRITVCPHNRPSPRPDPPSPSPPRPPTPKWEPCSTGPCCNPHTLIRQICPPPSNMPCEECGGGETCQCPRSDTLPLHSYVAVVSI